MSAICSNARSDGGCFGNAERGDRVASVRPSLKEWAISSEVLRQNTSLLACGEPCDIMLLRRLSEQRVLREGRCARDSWRFGIRLAGGIRLSFCFAFWICRLSFAPPCSLGAGLCSSIMPTPSNARVLGASSRPGVVSKRCQHGSNADSTRFPICFGAHSDDGVSRMRQIGLASLGH